MNIQSYLDRLNFHGPTTVDQSVLFSLQKKHLLHIPFENLDIHYGKGISLSINDIYQKIIIEKRGGFCYELNGLFNQLLRKIGFHTMLVSARVHMKNNTYSPEFDHLAIIVCIDNQKFLVDVGFGNFSLEPLKLDLNETIIDSFGLFKFDKYNRDYYRINEIIHKDSLPQYIFKMEERSLFEFENRSQFHQTSLDTHFKKKKLISIATSNGRITLNNSQLKITRSGISEEINFEDNEFEMYLKKYFDIEI